MEGREAPGHATAGGQGHADADLRYGLHITAADGFVQPARVPDEPDAATRTSGSVGGLGG